MVQTSPSEAVEMKGTCTRNTHGRLSCPHLHGPLELPQRSRGLGQHVIQVATQRRGTQRTPHRSALDRTHHLHT
jgi:hypothetical protein